MKRYFESYLLKWSEWNGTFPQVSFDTEIDQYLYVGEKDEEGYIFWKPREKDEYDDFQKLEKDGIKAVLDENDINIWSEAVNA